MTMPPSTAATAMQILRDAFPSLRRSEPTAIIHSGGQQTYYGCLCGGLHSCATNHRDAKHVAAFRDEHADCALALAQAVGEGRATLVHKGYDSTRRPVVAVA